MFAQCVLERWKQLVTLKKTGVSIILACLTLSAAGCSHWFLPKTNENNKSQWESYEDAENAFNAIELHRTSEQELHKMGYNPYDTPNIKVLTYLEMIEKFMPNPSITKKDLDPELADCLDAKDFCNGYVVSAKKIDKERHGNIILDVLRFNRKTRKRGWIFVGFIVMKNQKVVYKIHSGDPKIEENAEDTNPLGFLQDPLGLITDTVTGVAGF